MDRWSSAKLCDVANLLLGSSLFFSPWLFGLSAGAQTTIGLLIAVLAVAALAAFAVWEEWLSLIAGLWLIGSPWLLGFEDTDTVGATWLPAPSSPHWPPSRSGSSTKATAGSP
jgi:hypothetical protein